MQRRQTFNQFKVILDPTPTNQIKSKEVTNKLSHFYNQIKRSYKQVISFLQ
jgi:hypothetical protein